MNSLKDMLTNLILVLLSSFLLFFFIINAITTMNPSHPFLSDNSSNFSRSMSQINSSLSSIAQQTNSMSSSLASSEIDVSLLFLISKNFFYILKSTLSLALSVIFFIPQLILSNLGLLGDTSSPNNSLSTVFALILSTATVILIITLILLIIKAIRTGETTR